MATTIQVKDETAAVLKQLKNETRSGSYDDVIEKLLQKSRKEKSFYGFLGRKSKKEILKGLRDKHDRI